MEVVARVELLDRDGVRDGRRRTGSQRIDRDMADANRRLEAEIDHRPVEEVFGAGGTAARVVVEIREKRRHGGGQGVAAGQKGTELLRHEQGIVAILVGAECGVAVRLIGADQIEEHLAGLRVGLPRGVRGRPVDGVLEPAHRRCRELHGAGARTARPQRRDVHGGQRQRRQVLDQRGGAEAPDVGDAGATLEPLDVVEAFDEALDRGVDVHHPDVRKLLTDRRIEAPNHGGARIERPQIGVREPQRSFQPRVHRRTGLRGEGGAGDRESRRHSEAKKGGQDGTCTAIHGIHRDSEHPCGRSARTGCRRADKHAGIEDGRLFRCEQPRPGRRPTSTSGGASNYRLRCARIFVTGRRLYETRSQARLRCSGVSR